MDFLSRYSLTGHYIRDAKLSWRTNGLTQKEFCKEHNISLEKLRYQLYRKGKTQIKASKLSKVIKVGPVLGEKLKKR